MEDKLIECSWSNSSIRFGFKPQYVGGELHGAAIFEVMAIGKAAHALQPTTEPNCVAKFKIKAAELNSKKYLSVRKILFKNQQICWLHLRE